MGTTRMHATPEHGVVDENSRVHGTSNLFVAGSSVFPSGGYANPTLTIIALTLRLGDHLKRVGSARQGSVGSYSHDLFDPSEPPD
jgi:choline dehydrogenase-like flavoprotein